MTRFKPDYVGQLVSQGLGNSDPSVAMPGLSPAKPPLSGKARTLPPYWKIRREIIRIADRASDRLPLTFMQDMIRQRLHDRRLDRLVRETAGHLPLCQKVAVFILFQPKGIARSTYFTLDHMAQSGWSVVVVSNTPLQPSDRQRLAAKCSHVIERPNTGYDFGAYREGWRWIGRKGHQPERLILMNDSTWFPLRRSDDTLERMERLDLDLTGHVFKTEQRKNRGLDHLESHLLMFGPRALAHPDIRAFMDSFVMSNSKSVTIRRGEKGMSQAAIAAGLSVKGLFGREEMVELLAGLSDEDLRIALCSLALHTDAGRAQRTAWLADDDAGRPWRDAFLAWTFDELSNTHNHLVGAAFIDPAMCFGGMGYLKKHSEPRFQLARLAVMRGVREGRIAALEPVVAEEIEATIRSWKRPMDWRTDPSKMHEVPAL